MDTSWDDSRKYNQVLRYACLEPLELCQETCTPIPQIVKNLILYELSGHIRHGKNTENVTLTSEQRSEYLILLSKIFCYLSVEDIVCFSKHQGTRLLDREHLAIICIVFGKNKLISKSYFRFFDDNQQLSSFIVYTNMNNNYSFMSNGHKLPTLLSKSMQILFCGVPCIVKSIIWIPFNFTSTLQLTVDEQEERIYFLNLERNYLPIGIKPRSKSSPDKCFPWKVKLLRLMMKFPLIRNRYKKYWLFIDRDFIADDNAEHFYRWMQHNHPEIPTAFVLKRNCRDWKRLKREGFRLVAYRSIMHYIILSACAWLLSSHANKLIFSSYFEQYFGDLQNYLFCFLQHGIIKDDLSKSLNRWPIDIFVTSTEREYYSITEDYPYKFTMREVKLTGLPRHDALFKLVSSYEKPKYIVFAPTWRAYLVGKPVDNKTFAKQKNNVLLRSNFYIRWNRILQDESIHKTIKEFRYDITFLPHPDMDAHALDFIQGTYSSNITVFNRNDSIQNLLANTALLITDYSSIAMEMALIRRPILYYQFDIDEFYSHHTYKQGYFDYERDGFGKVCKTHDELVMHINDCIKNKCIVSDIYKNRSQNFFESAYLNI